uniref:Uncharacterized protein n=1 Tax=Clytia hemisphaerica TaxID=252671 RepID=A0A7M5X584_9CNID
MVNLKTILLLIAITQPTEALHCNVSHSPTTRTKKCLPGITKCSVQISEYALFRKCLPKNEEHLCGKSTESGVSVCCCTDNFCNNDALAVKCSAVSMTANLLVIFVTVAFIFIKLL